MSFIQQFVAQFNFLPLSDTGDENFHKALLLGSISVFIW